MSERTSYGEKDIEREQASESERESVREKESFWREG